MKRLTMMLIAVTLMVGVMLALSNTAAAQMSVGISVRLGPPALPVYPQPFAPGPGFIWVPGYWAYGPYGYYWVPGTWVLAPRVGFLWTPGYWGWRGGFYWWHPGYWGPRVGFYGGINYGYGYGGVGFVGGYWQNGAFYYNRAVSNVNVAYIHNTYKTTINNATNLNRVSYNGGQGGIRAQPTAEQQAYAGGRHAAPTAAQIRQQHVAMNNPAQRFSANHGHPTIAATARPGKFNGPGVVRLNRAKGTYAYRPVPRDRAAYRANHGTRRVGVGHHGRWGGHKYGYGQPHSPKPHANRTRRWGGPPR